MLLFLWGEFRGHIKNSLRQVPNYSENNGIPNGVSSMPTDETSLAQDACLGGPIDKISSIQTTNGIVTPRSLSLPSWLSVHDIMFN
nr:NBS-LRR resistance-like protein [Tanacetum cinerariifolium]